MHLSASVLSLILYPSASVSTPDYASVCLSLYSGFCICLPQSLFLIMHMPVLVSIPDNMDLTDSVSIPDDAICICLPQSLSLIIHLSASVFIPDMHLSASVSIPDYASV